MDRDSHGPKRLPYLAVRAEIPSTAKISSQPMYIKYRYLTFTILTYINYFLY